MAFYDTVTVSIYCYQINKHEDHQVSLQSSWEDNRVNAEWVPEI
jgi:hypothetical protein